MSVTDLIRAQKLRHRCRLALAEIATRDFAPRPHGLDFPLVVSLTSHRARFGTLAQTLRGLLRQTVRADRTVLWLEDADRPHLPPEILALQDEGLTIGQSEAYRSYGKIVPSLLAFPGHGIVVADDDVYYWPDWLEGLVAAHKARPRPVLCHRADRISLDAEGRIAPYDDWQRPMRRAGQSALVVATGVMGVLYAPGALHEDTTRRDLYQALCPTADDLWLYWMYRLMGHEAARVPGPRRRIVEWPGTQDVSLRSVNMLGADGNDRAIAAMIARYGPVW